MNDITPPSLQSPSDLSAADIGATDSHTLTFDEAIGSVSVGAVPTGMTVTPSQVGNTVTLQISTDATFTAFGSVTIPVNVADGVPNSGTVNVTKTINDVAPVAGGAFASLADMTISDASGDPILPINAGGATDPIGRNIIYSVSGLPPGLSIDPSTGVISGIYDVTSVPAPNTEDHTVTVTASNGSIQIQKSFVLSIQNDG